MPQQGSRQAISIDQRCSCRAKGANWRIKTGDSPPTTCCRGRIKSQNSERRSQEDGNYKHSPQIPCGYSYCRTLARGTRHRRVCVVEQTESLVHSNTTAACLYILRFSSNGNVFPGWVAHSLHQRCGRCSASLEHGAFERNSQATHVWSGTRSSSAMGTAGR